MTYDFDYINEIILKLVFLKKYVKISNATYTNSFTIFLQTVDVTNFYKFLFESIIKITFLLTNNHPLHH